MSGESATHKEHHRHNDTERTPTRSTKTSSSSKDAIRNNLTAALGSFDMFATVLSKDRARTHSNKPTSERRILGVTLSRSKTPMDDSVPHTPSQSSAAFSFPAVTGSRPRPKDSTPGKDAAPKSSRTNNDTTHRRNLTSLSDEDRRSSEKSKPKSAINDRLRVEIVDGDVASDGGYRTPPTPISPRKLVHSMRNLVSEAPLSEIKADQFIFPKTATTTVKKTNLVDRDSAVNAETKNDAASSSQLRDDLQMSSDDDEETDDPWSTMMGSALGGGGGSKEVKVEPEEEMVKRKESTSTKIINGMRKLQNTPIVPPIDAKSRLVPKLKIDKAKLTTSVTKTEPKSTTSAASPTSPTTSSSSGYSSTSATEKLPLATFTDKTREALLKKWSARLGANSKRPSSSTKSDGRTSKSAPKSKKRSAERTEGDDVIDDVPLDKRKAEVKQENTRPPTPSSPSHDRKRSANPLAKTDGVEKKKKKHHKHSSPPSITPTKSPIPSSSPAIDMPTLAPSTMDTDADAKPSVAAAPVPPPPAPIRATPRVPILIGKVEPMPQSVGGAQTGTMMSVAPQRASRVDGEETLRDFGYYHHEKARPLKHEAQDLSSSNNVLKQLKFLESTVYFIYSTRCKLRELRDSSTPTSGAQKQMGYVMLRDVKRLLEDVSRRFRDSLTRTNGDPLNAKFADRLIVIACRAQSILAHTQYAHYKSRIVSNERTIRQLTVSSASVAQAHKLASSTGVSTATSTMTTNSPVPSPASSLNGAMSVDGNKCAGCAAVPPGYTIVNEVLQTSLKQQVDAMSLLVDADRCWSEAHAKLTQQTDKEFFAHLDKLCATTLRMDSSLYDLSVHMLTALQWLYAEHTALKSQSTDGKTEEGEEERQESSCAAAR